MVRRQAAEQGRSERGLIEEMLEESIRARRLPGIAFRGGPTGRRAWVLGTPFDVWEMMDSTVARGGRGSSRSMESPRAAKPRAGLLRGLPRRDRPEDRRQRSHPAEWHRLSPSVIPAPPPEENKPG